ncbi:MULTISPECIES: hypothetical protein [unclassified Aminobacter]|uniref:hypothetical protein n=1 Tax=unclassified Aminobacter TaxID=2644704 RepID=UPI0004AC5F52|nr:MULTISPECIES: hypothetical protein [unclassified Aminobacter]TWH28917.1 hypothetical protein L611_003600000310 [Aminobacter sp. J15]
MSLHEILSSIGIDPAVLYAGAGGGLLRAISRRRLRIREVVLSPVCGALASAYLTLPVVQYVTLIGAPVPDDPAKVVLAMAFLIGTSAMWLSDLFLSALARKLGLSPRDVTTTP